VARCDHGVHKWTPQVRTVFLEKFDSCDDVFAGVVIE